MDDAIGKLITYENKGIYKVKGMEKLSDNKKKQIRELRFFGLGHLISTFRFSYDGFLACFKSEVAFRQEIMCAVVNVIAVFSLPLSFSVRLLMIALCIIVLCFELINTGVEAVVDLETTDFHPLAKKAKDVCSAAVFFAISAFVLSWVAIIVKLIYFDA